MKHALLFLICIFSCSLVSAQVLSSSGLLGNYGPPSPEAASLGKYIDHPVGYYTGTPIINIPLYEITIGRIKVPISISYHASGVKVDEIASRVGTGFSLNAGGVITTVVKGSPDDGLGCYFDRNPNQWMMPGQDLEPDIHYYKFGAKQGKIYFVNRETATTIDNDPIKIIGPYKGDKRFIITTEEGIIYKFEAVEGNRQSITQDLNGYVFTSNSFYLTEIEDPVSLEKVKFIYRTDMPSNMPYISKRSEGSSMLYCNVFNPAPTDNNSVVLGAKVLQRIEYTDGFIEFKADHGRLDLIGDRAYTEINQYVQRGFGSPVLRKGFNLSYAYTMNGGSVEGRRLYLESIQEKGTDGSFLPPYVFSYKNRDALPPRNSYQQDIWGFYNANGTVTLTSYPKVYIYNNAGKCSYLPIKIDGLGASSTVAGVDRSSNPLTIDYGVLNKVKYPTKGYTTYDYEPHMFGYDADYGGHPTSLTFKQGGIRVKDIKDFSANGELLLHKNYNYYIGHLGGPLPQVAVPTSGYYSHFRFSQNQSLLGSCQGSYVGYEGVIEIVKEQFNKRSATTYHYSKDSDVEGRVELHSNYCSDFSNLAEIRRDTFFPFFEMESRESRRGLLLMQEFFNDYQMVQGEQPIKKIEYTYDLWSKPIASINSTYDAGNSAITLYGFRSLNQEKMLLTSKKETEYTLTGDSIILRTDYNYTENKQFLRSETVYSRNDEPYDPAVTPFTERGIQKIYKYPFDYAPTASSGIMGKMVAMNYINAPISEVKKTVGHPDDNPVYHYLEAKITNYKSFLSYGPLPQDVFQLKSAIVENSNNYPLVFPADPANPGAKYEKRLEYLKYQNGAYPSLILKDKIYEYYVWSPSGLLFSHKRTVDPNHFEYKEPPRSWKLFRAPDERTEKGYFVWDGLDYSVDTDIPHLLDGNRPTHLSFWAKDGIFEIGSSNQEFEGVSGIAPGIWTYYSFLIPTLGNAGWVDSWISLTGTAKLDDFLFSTEIAEETHYDYDAYYRLKHIIDPSGKIERYEYDPFSRLKYVKDREGNIIKSYDYNYKL